MLIKVGDTIKTDALVGEVLEIIRGKERGWKEALYYRVKVMRPRVYWKRNTQIVGVNEVRAKL